MKHRVNTPEQALAYITDCCLATVSHMATLKSRKKNEFERQISIAQTACDWMKDFNIDPTGTSAEEIINICSVKEWAEQYTPFKT
jgi:hypothetical protein